MANIIVRIRSGFCSCLIIIVVVAVVKFMENKFKIQILANRMIYVERKTQKNILSSRWELSPRPSMGYIKTASVVLKLIDT